ncbi:pentapeptide repeat-containing protein, partial [Escherichia coli]|nr:pentapeptide repeat-containing protein [Escherichia coli]
LEYTSFVGANLDRALLQGANAAGARFTSASLRFAMLSDTDLRGASFLNADLRGADFVGADLAGTSLRGARLEGAKLVDQDASLVGNCIGATFDEATAFAPDWMALPDSECEAARQPWVAKGM